MKDHITQLNASLQMVKDLHEELRALALDIMDEAKKGGYTQQDRVDLGFLFRELESQFDEDRKDAKARKELLSKLIAFTAIQTTEDVGSIRGELATGTPDVSQMVELPKQDSPEYRRVCDHLEVPEAVRHLLKLDWKKVQRYATECAEEGKKLPPGFGTPRPVYSCGFRRRQ